jgi:hypothetical protein
LAAASRPVLGLIQPPIQWVQGASSPGIKRLGSEADHSPPSVAEVNNAWRHTSTPHVFIAWCLVKHRENFTFTLSNSNLNQVIGYHDFRHVNTGIVPYNRLWPTVSHFFTYSVLKSSFPIL